MMNRHILKMVLCFAIPLGLIFLLPYFGLTTFSGSVLLLIVLLCPVMHLWMMFYHGHQHTPEHNGGELR